MSQEPLFISKWKDDIKDIIKMKYPDCKMKEVDIYLNNTINKSLKTRKTLLTNNYSNKYITTDLMVIFQKIIENKFIIGGGGCLFQQHGVIENPLIDFITYLMDLRTFHKDKMYTLPEDSIERLIEELIQGNYKIKVNSLYGVLLCATFIFYNVFLGQSVTNLGQRIISTATMAFEDFLSDNNPFFDLDETICYIKDINNEYKNKFKDIDFSEIPKKTESEVLERLKKKMSFNYTKDEEKILYDILSNLNKNVLKMVYYKNNIDKFNEISIVEEKYKYILGNIDLLLQPNPKQIKNKKVLKRLEELEELIDVFIFAPYPIYDRIRKSKYWERKTALYTDTDSDFISIHKWKTKLIRDIYPNSNSKLSITDANFTIVNLIAIIVMRMVNTILKNMCRDMNVSEKYADLLIMKNEKYYHRILFTDSKKRYVGLEKMTEGHIVNNGEGKPDIKGFDFIKSVTKPIVRNTYERIILDEILKADIVSPKKIFKQILQFKQEIEDSLSRGETIYYKQANVGIIEKYKAPYSIQGIKGVTLWNILLPEYQIELPTDVDIIPIKTFENAKNRKRFQEKFPEQFNLIDKYIFKSTNPDIAKMELNSLAKPKNNDLELPEWYFYLIDTDKIVLDTINLFLPILQSLGFKSLGTTSKITHITNIVSL